MNCSVCGGPGAYRVRSRGEESVLCERCARQTGNAPVIRMLRALQKSPLGKLATCPHCGWTVKRLSDQGFLGCPLCYEVFKTEILAGFADA